MQSIKVTLYSATNSFGLERAQQLVEKTWREHQRATDATNVHDYRDALLNGMITSWHLVDWVWAGISQENRRDPDLCKLFGIPPGRPTKNDFLAWVLRECPEMQICQSICNGTKHVNSDRPTKTGLRESDDTYRKNTHGFAAFIETDAGDRLAVDILWNVGMFWFEQATRGHIVL
ncbi:hypothetical protein [Rhizobium leguminosarum]|uniref:hypothetical protein n=1 Tax=Rhizobium leguminosarum TaxID=384 RepID=UPI003F9C68F9